MIDYDLNKIYLWPIGLRIFITIIVFIVVLYLGYFFDISSIKKQIVFSQKNEEKLLQDYRAVVIQEVSLNMAVTKLPELKKMFQDWKNKLIKPSNINEAFTNLIKSNNSSLELNLLKEESSQKVGKWTKTAINVNVTGNYDQTAHFISGIANLPMLIKMDKFTMTSLKSPDKQASDIDKQNSLPTLLSHDNILDTHLMLEVYED